MPSGLFSISGLNKLNIVFYLFFTSLHASNFFKIFFYLMPLDTILTFDSWHMTDMEAGPSRMAPTAFVRWRRVVDISRVQGKGSHLIIDDSVINSIVGGTVPAVELATVQWPRLTPDVPRALEDPTLIDNYSMHGASLIWQQGYLFVYFMYLVLFHTCVLCKHYFFLFFCRSTTR